MKNLLINTAIVIVVLAGLHCYSYFSFACIDDGNKSVFYYKAANNEEYVNNCGTCHFPYPPNLLPLGSWEKIMAATNDHFGEVIEFTPEAKQTILTYLASNSAERFPTELSKKIMISLKGQLPIRITDIPHVKHIHEDINYNANKMKAKPSLSNCIACHKYIENNLYMDDDNCIEKYD